MNIFRINPIIIASALVLASCHNLDDMNKQKRLVSFVQYMNDESCWGRMDGQKVHFQGLALYKRVEGDGIAIWPVSSLCRIDERKSGGPSLAYLGMARIGSIDSNELSIKYFEGSKIRPYFPPEGEIIGKNDRILYLDMTCTIAHPARAKNNLLLERCTVANIVDRGRVTGKFVQSI